MPKVLLVEDNEMNLDMLSRRLRRRGYEVLAARDGAEGVETAQKELPDLILMDISLPVMDGYEATRILKASSTTGHIPILGLSAHAMTGDAQKALQAGCDDYDTKPVQLKRLLGKMEDLLEKREPTGRDPAPESAGLAGPPPSGPTPAPRSHPPDSPVGANALEQPVVPPASPVSAANGVPEGPPAISRPAATTRPSSASPSARPLSRGRILVAGGGVGQFQTISELLGQLGYTAEHSRDDASTLGRAERQGLEAILLDHRTTGIQADRLIPELRSRPRTKSIPIIVVTSTDEISSAFRCIRLGAEAYLPFPFSLDLLAMRLRIILEKRDRTV